MEKKSANILLIPISSVDVEDPNLSRFREQHDLSLELTNWQDYLEVHFNLLLILIL